MNNQDELFLLIKSLNKNEKGYFRKFSGIHSNKGEGNYQKLFDCIAEMKEYHEGQLKDAMKGEKMLKHLKVTKHYLKNLIIRALVNYYSTSDPEIELLHALPEVSILIKKQLYDGALKRIETLKKQAREEENFITVLRLLQMEHLVLIRKGAYQKISSYSKKHLHEEMEYLGLHENLCQYRNLHGLIYSKMQTEGHYEKESADEIREFLAHPLLTDAYAALSFKANLYRFDMLEICYRRLNNPDKSLEAAYQMAALFRANPVQITLQPMNYHAVINRIGARLNVMGRFDEALEFAEQAEELAHNKQLKLNSDRVFEILISVYLLRLAIFAKWGDFESGLRTDKKIALLIKHKPLRTDLLIVRTYYNAFCYIGKGQFDKALDHVNTLIHGKFNNTRTDLILCTHWMGVMIHFELGNYTLIKRLVTVSRNFMVKNKFAAMHWDRFLNQLKQLVKAGADKNYKALKSALQALLNDVDSYSFIDNDFMRWWVGNKLKQMG